MASLSHRSMPPLFAFVALGALMMLGGCSSYTTGYYPGRHYGEGVRQHYTNDQGNNIGYTINPRSSGSRAQTPPPVSRTVHYSRAPLARGGYTYAPGVYVAGDRDTSVAYTATLGINTLGRRGYRHYPGHFGFTTGGFETYSFGGGYHSGFGFGVYQSGYYGGAHGGHYGGHYAGHGSHRGGHGSHHRSHGSSHDRNHSDRGHRGGR